MIKTPYFHDIICCTICWSKHSPFFLYLCHAFDIAVVGKLFTSYVWHRVSSTYHRSFDSIDRFFVIITQPLIILFLLKLIIYFMYTIPFKKYHLFMLFVFTKLFNMQMVFYKALIISLWISECFRKRVLMIYFTVTN